MLHRVTRNEFRRLIKFAEHFLIAYHAAACLDFPCFRGVEQLADDDGFRGNATDFADVIWRPAEDLPQGPILRAVR